MLRGDTLLFEFEPVGLLRRLNLELLLLELQLALLDLKLLHLHLHQRVLHHLLVLLLLRFGLVLLEQLLGSSSGKPRHGQLSLLVHFSVRRRQRHTGLLFDLLAIGERQVFRDVRVHSGHHALRIGVLPHELLDFGVLHSGHMDGDVRLVVLVYKRLDRLAVDDVHVLADRITWLAVVVVLERHELLGVLDPQHLKHLPVQVGHVVNLRRTLSQLDDRLILDDLLSHGRSVRVADGDDLDVVVVRLLGLAAAFLRLVGVAVGGVVADDTLEEPELLLHRVVHARLHSRHHLQRALKDSQRGAHRGLARHVADLHISSASELAAFIDDGA